VTGRSLKASDIISSPEMRSRYTIISVEAGNAIYADLVSNNVLNIATKMKIKENRLKMYLRIFLVSEEQLISV
jgi:hypothetical protein